jgi:4-hydroxy-tetrahydrodipicolinate synthase
VIRFFAVSKLIFEGLTASLLTPFDQNGALVPELLEAQVKRIEGAGIDAFCVGAYCGELAGADPGEIERVCAIVRRTTRKPVTVNLYPDCTQEALALAASAVNGGADAVAVAQPHYLFQPGRSGLEEMFAALRRDVRVPLLLSNTLPNAMLDASEVESHAGSGLIDGIYQGGSDAHLLADTLSATGRVPVITAVEELMYIGVLLGAEGALSTLAAVLPEETVNLYRSARSGNFVEARRAHERLLRLWRSLDHPTESLSRLKLAAHAQGLPAGVPRRPYDCASSQTGQVVLDALRRESLLSGT